MEEPSRTSNKKRKRGPSHAPSKTFERVFQGSPPFPFHAPNSPYSNQALEHSLDDIKRVVRRKLGLAGDRHLDVQLTQIRGHSSIVLEDGK
jgi:hypothetical protein